MATYVKFNTFVGDLIGKVHDLLGTAGSTADTLKIYLSNTAPTVTTNAVKADLAEITNQNGYSAPVSTGNVGVNTAGTVTVTGTNITITASGGSVGPFRYIVLYNSTAASGPLVAYWDYGSNLTLNAGDSFVIKFNNGVSSGTIFTLA